MANTVALLIQISCLPYSDSCQKYFCALRYKPQRIYLANPLKLKGNKIKHKAYQY